MVIKIAIIAGTRPELIKLSPLLKLLSNDPYFSLLFIHAGQHYDYNMSKIFLEDLELPVPITNLECGSGTHGYQTGILLIKLEKLLLKHKPNVVIAEGDTNTVVASALASCKSGICFMHLEAGIRSFDKKMPEEINRMIVAPCAMFHFVPTERAAFNLLFEGIERNSIFNVGNTIVDAIFQIIEIAEKKSTIINDLKLRGNLPLILITLHRPSNVDNKERFSKFFNTISEINEFQFIFPIHPRTKRNLETFGLLDKIKKKSHVLIIEPIGYLDFLKLLSNSICVLTDSGGIQEEASVLRIPCITVRNNTERPETIEYKSNVLVGSNFEKMRKEIYKIKSNLNYLKGKPTENPFGDGKAALKIIAIIKKLHKEGRLKFFDSNLWKIIPKKRIIKITESSANTTVKEFENTHKVEINIIFDKNGSPLFPKDKTLLIKSYHILVRTK